MIDTMHSNKKGHAGLALLSSSSPLVPPSYIFLLLCHAHIYAFRLQPEEENTAYPCALASELKLGILDARVQTKNPDNMNRPNDGGASLL